MVEANDPVADWLAECTDGRVSSHTITMLSTFRRWYDHKALAERDALIAELREALEWYAEPVLTYAITQAAEPRSAVHADGGKRARKALAALENSNG